MKPMFVPRDEEWPRSLLTAFVRGITIGLVLQTVIVLIAFVFVIFSGCASSQSWDNVDFQSYRMKDDIPKGEPLTTPERDRLAQILGRDEELLRGVWFDYSPDDSGVFFNRTTSTGGQTTPLISGHSHNREDVFYFINATCKVVGELCPECGMIVYDTTASVLNQLPSDYNLYKEYTDWFKVYGAGNNDCDGVHVGTIKGYRSFLKNRHTK